MRKYILGLVPLLFCGATAATVLADPSPTTAPAQPAARHDAERVEVFRFEEISQTRQSEWIGRGIQESLQNEVSRTGATLLIPGQVPPVNAEPLTVARENKADLAIVGTFQLAGDDVRVTGHLVDTQSGNTVGGFSATVRRRISSALKMLSASSCAGYCRLCRSRFRLRWIRLPSSYRQKCQIPFIRLILRQSNLR